MMPLESTSTATIIIGGIVSIIGALVTGAIAIIAALKAYGRKTGDKLDTIELLVDGRYSDVLAELADVRQLLAEQTGTTRDRKKATDARTRSNAQAQRVKQSRKS